MKVYICFHIYRNRKTIYLVFRNKEKVENFLSKHPEFYQEEWEVIE